MNKSPAEKYNIARSNLLLMMVLTVINMVLVFVESDTMLLFSATVPYFFTILGYGWSSAICYAVAIVALAVYVACWIFSKKHYGWMIAATVWFSLDSLFLIGVYFLAGEISGILDFIIHAWVMYYLILGIVSGVKMKREPQVEAYPQSGAYPQAEAYPQAQAYPQMESYQQMQPQVYTQPIRMAEQVKARILLEENVYGRQVVYRRVKRINELVIDGYVYDQYTALVETGHALHANLDGHMIEVGFDGTANSYMKVDGQIVQKKLRLY